MSGFKSKGVIDIRAEEPEINGEKFQALSININGEKVGYIFAFLKNKQDRDRSEINPNNFIHCHFMPKEAIGHELKKLLSKGVYNCPQDMINEMDVVLSKFLPLFKDD